MSGPAQFWIPSIFEIDDILHDPIADPIIPDNFNVGPILGRTGIDTKCIQEFLTRVSHSFEALFLAGYKVPWVEFGLQNITSAPVTSNQIWLRVDLQNRQFEVNRRADTDSTNRVRMQILPIVTPAKSHALDMGPARMLHVISQVSTGQPHSRTIETTPMVDFLNAGLAPPELQLTDSDVNPRGVMKYREDIAVSLQGLSETGGILDIDLGFDHPMVAANLAKPLRTLIFDAFQYAIFDSITWVMGHITIAAVDDFVIPAITANETPDTKNLPGMCWIISPETWETGTQRNFGSGKAPQDIETLLGTLKTTPQMLVDLLEIGGSVTRSDPVPEDDDTDASRVKSEKVIGFLYGIARGFSLKSVGSPGIRVENWSMNLHARMIDIMLGHAARASYYEIRRKNDKDPRATLLAVHPLYKINDSLEGLLHDAFLSVGGDTGSMSLTIDGHLKDFRYAYSGLVTAFGQDDPTKKVKPKAKAVLNYSYTTLILSLFNFGVFSIEQITGDLNADLPEAGVEVFDDISHVPTSIGAPQEQDQIRRLRFKPKLYDQPGFIVWQLNSTPENLTLDDLVAWEYVPAQPEPPPELKPALIQAGLFPADNRDRLILVAGPGIAIGPLDGWPTHVPVDIYRVQSPALVPDRNERINPDFITKPYTISILDDIDPISGQNLVNDRDRRHNFQAVAVEHPDRVPFVTVTPVRRNGKCGVSIATKSSGNAYYQGITGTGAVEILVDERSGSDRFAFDIRYDIVSVRRAVGTHVETRMVFRRDYDAAPHEVRETVIDYDTVDAAQFQIVVKATDGVEISINDDKIFFLRDALWNLFKNTTELVGETAQYFTDPVDDVCLYEIWRASNISKIPIQGVRLSPGGTGFTEYLDAYWEPVNRNIAENLQFIIDLTLGFCPFVGEATDVIELAASLYTGTDKWGRPMSNFDRMLIVGGLAMPLVSGKTLRVVAGELPPDTLLRLVAGLD